MLQRPDANAIPSTRGVDWSPLPLSDLRLRALQFMRRDGISQRGNMWQ